MPAQGHRRGGLPGWNPRRRFALVLLCGVLWGSGLGLVLWPAAGIPDMSEAGRAARHAVLALHSGLAWLLCILVGMAVWPHVARSLAQVTRGWQWHLGLLLLGLLAALGLSGFMLLYGPATTQQATLSLHWLAGLVWPLPMCVHLWNGLQKSRQGRAQAIASVRRAQNP